MKTFTFFFILFLFGCVATSNQTIKTPVNPEEQKLINQISSENDQIAQKAINILGRQDNASPAIIKKYEAMFKSCNNYDRIEALLDSVYLYNNQSDFLPGLEICLNSSNEDIRDEAIDIISDIESKKAIDILIEALANPYPDVRDEARDSLETITDKSFDCQPRWKQWWKNNRKNFSF